jgi:hypothetical protein
MVKIKVSDVGLGIMCVDVETPENQMSIHEEAVNSLLIGALGLFSSYGSLQITKGGDDGEMHRVDAESHVDEINHIDHWVYTVDVASHQISRKEVEEACEAVEKLINELKPLAN